MHAGNVFFHLFISFVLATCGIIVLLRFHKILRNIITNETLRRNIVALIVILLFHWGLAPLIPDLTIMMNRYGLLHAFLLYSTVMGAASLIIYNIGYFFTNYVYFKQRPFLLHQLFILLSIIISTIIVFLFINYYFNNYSTKYFTFSMAWSFYFSSIAGSINLIINYIHRDKAQRDKLNELEFSRLNELKIKAELDALQSKINPHFLYNALNSIADLTITDSVKARVMTLALSDLFRYSINNTNGVYNTVDEELKIISTYMDIEKIRFEDRLVYKVSVGANTARLLIPKFLLQPLVENAIKHGLKKSGQILIIIETTSSENELKICIFDNGSPFPENLVPGYGMKNVMDKLKLIYPQKHELAFLNTPKKHVLIRLKKLHE